MQLAVGALYGSVLGGPLGASASSYKHDKCKIKQKTDPLPPLLHTLQFHHNIKYYLRTYKEGLSRRSWGSTRSGVARKTRITLQMNGNKLQISVVQNSMIYFIYGDYTALKCTNTYT